MTRPSKNSRIFLSPPHMSGQEIGLITQAIDSNWVAPAGPHLAEFEKCVAEYVGTKHAVALASGTAALHLSLRHLDLQPDDEVICSTLTFAASANVIAYERAKPVFVDSELDSWNMDPALLESELSRARNSGRKPRAVICVDLYGQCAEYSKIAKICGENAVPLIEDAAEALGATSQGRPAGSFGWANVFSFNGNKIITTSGGGMLATDDDALAAKARFLSQQARDPAPHYEHSHIGYNYRMSNILAAIGLGQMAVLDQRVAAKRQIFEWYRGLLGKIPGITFMPEPASSHSNRWLTCIRLNPKVFGVDRTGVMNHLEKHNIESRPIWKPMHLQPIFSKCRVVGGKVSESIFSDGLCLPSGTAMTQGDICRVAELILAAPKIT